MSVWTLDPVYLYPYYDSFTQSPPCAWRNANRSQQNDREPDPSKVRRMNNHQGITSFEQSPWPTFLSHRDTSIPSLSFYSIPFPRFASFFYHHGFFLSYYSFCCSFLSCSRRGNGQRQYSSSWSYSSSGCKKNLDSHHQPHSS